MGAMPGRYTVATVFTDVEAWSKDEARDKVERALAPATEDEGSEPTPLAGGVVIVSVTATRDPE